MGLELPSDNAGFYEMEDVNFSDSELVHHVRDALKSVALGDSDSYDQLVGVMHHTRRLAPDEVALLVTSLKALSGAVSYIDVVHHESLLSSIFGMSMWNLGPDAMDALVELIISLAASNGKYVDSSLDMLVKNFMPPYYFLDTLRQPHGLTRKNQVLTRVHSALKDITDLVPLAPVRLLPIIIQNMPSMYIKDPEKSTQFPIVIYVENMLKLESSAIGELVGNTILMAVVDRLIDLDVEIGWDDNLPDESNKGIFEMELEDKETTDNAENEASELQGEFFTRKSLGGNTNAEKLDSLMVLTFEHLESCDRGGRLIEVFETLLQSFQITVLNAYKSKFAQFVMFYACSLNPESCGVRFPSMLADIFTCSIYPPVTRMSAVAYLASYLSRGKFLSASLVASMLKRVVDWCSEYCQIQDGHINYKSSSSFLFWMPGHHVCALLPYEINDGCSSTQIRASPYAYRAYLEASIESIKVNCIHYKKAGQVCLPSIVKEFLRQAKAACLFTVSETFVFNDMLESELSKAFGGMERLDTFFPFDPCLLRNC
ncbi:hypothetical protein L1049_013162 [Liquidambar formosana]|uniref:RNA polymerase I-specific transcription initiation factor RRN3 n=1 Tax=Liquidambar formosana TaxID=63359 RepID=A0AAP0RL56_LIQFO